MISKHSIGTKLRVRLVEGKVPVALSGALVLQLQLRKPSDALVTVDATPVTNGDDGRLQYVTEDVDDLNETGRWALRAYVELADGWKGHSTWGQFDVE